ncbi:hypothetical protein A2U01_0078623, partial [Trifolium medium]|nr:hypothetical protein [Trifolium medium]
LKVLNPIVELNTEGLSMLKRVENGQIVIPPEYAQMEDKEEDEPEGGEDQGESNGEDVA